MLRWGLVLSLLACDKGPIVEHRIHYEEGGLGATGPVAQRVDADLDKRSLVSTSQTGVVTQRALDTAMTKELGDLAGCTRDETRGRDPMVDDMYVKLALYGDKTVVIEQSGPLTAPCASKLSRRLGMLAGWHD